MAYTFPLALDQFFDGLPIKSVAFDLGEALEMSETGAGEVLTADLGPRLWTAKVALRLGHYAEIEQVKAKLNLLRYAGRSLIVHAMPLIAPQADPTGAILGASAVKLANVAANNRDVTLSGLPPGYVLTVADGLSFTYGSNPVRYAYHQLASNAVADGAGNATFEVGSFIRPGYTLNIDVRLIKPRFKAIVRPGSTNAGVSGSMITDGVSFDLIQTLR